MIPVHDLFESHLNVTDLQRSMSFFGQTLGLELAEVSWERRVAFYWIGGRGNSMLGLWDEKKWMLPRCRFPSPRRASQYRERQASARS